VRSKEWEALKEFDALMPKIKHSARWYLKAFYDLDTERNHGNGLMKIPRSAILEYAAECGLNEPETYDLVQVIRTVDDAHIERLAADRDAKLS
jgi:hypothetical protein